MTLDSFWRCRRDAPDDSPQGCDAGIEAVELALVTALIVVIILAVMPLLDSGITATFQSVADAFNQGIN
jgi:Flp pilus assembly pilin Flp